MLRLSRRNTLRSTWWRMRTIRMSEGINDLLLLRNTEKYHFICVDFNWYSTFVVVEAAGGAIPRARSNSSISPPAMAKLLTPALSRPGRAPPVPPRFLFKQHRKYRWNKMVYFNAMIDWSCTAYNIMQSEEKKAFWLWVTSLVCPASQTPGKMGWNPFHFLYALEELILTWWPLWWNYRKERWKDEFVVLLHLVEICLPS